MSNPLNTTEPELEIELRTIILQFLAEYHQGLNELNGKGTPIEQVLKTILAYITTHYLPKEDVVKAVGEQKMSASTPLGMPESLETSYRAQDDLRKEILSKLKLIGGEE